MAATAAASLYTSASHDDRVRMRDRYERLRGALVTQRATFDTHWKDLADWMLPRRIRLQLSDTNRGDRRNQNIIDSTATFAARTLQSGLHAGLTSPARPWLRLSTPDKELAEHRPVKQWLHTATARILTLCLQSNLYNVLPTVYGDMGVFGSAAMSVLDDDEDTFRCYSYPIGSFAIALDRRRIVGTFVHDYRMTVEQCVEEFGPVDGNRRNIDRSRFSTAVLDLYDRGDYYAPVDVCWVVEPNKDHEPGALGRRRFPFRSCHFEVGRADHEGVLRESGFRRFPIMVPRWDVTGEDSYGTSCPGMIALGDTRALQIMQKRKGQAVEKQVNPPLVGPAVLKTQHTSSVAGDITYVDTREGMQGLKAIYDVQARIADLTADMFQTQRRIQRAFFEDLFLMLANQDETPAGQPITAREVQERHEEKLLALGPVLERTNDELLDPFVDRVYEQMQLTGQLPPAPPELEGEKLRVEYTSIMAEAQKLVGAVAHDRFISGIAALAPIFPAMVHKVNTNQWVDDSADILGVNPNLVNSNDDANASMQAAQKALQQTQDAETVGTLAKSAQALGNTPMQGDTALNRIAEGAQQ